MGFPANVSLKFQDYKSFSDDIQGFDHIAPINIIIGKNNSGKSSLIDIVDFATNPIDIDRFGHIGRKPKVYISGDVTQEMIEPIFQRGTGGGDIGGDHFQYGEQWIGDTITAHFTHDNPPKFHKFNLNVEMIERYRDKVASRFNNPFTPKVFKRISAERNIVPESPTSPNLQSNGSGATNLIQHFLNASNANQKFVEDSLLSALNEIFFPDTKFTRIQTKRLEGSEQWEIFLEEEEKGNIALSNSGSGLQTIILVLAQTILIPELESKSTSDYIFAFEELENNLHPGLQRRLLMYLRDLAINKDATFFITTHSNIVIDLFSGDDKAQLLHVKHDNRAAHVETLTDFVSRNGVLDDLDVRASDILQSNSVIWVEGPSDRVYVNRYIELFTDGKLWEGAHYQCVYYGGKLLARVTADPSDEEKANLLKVNRHSSLMMDSDRTAARSRINATKRRMKEEIESVNGYVWVTDGKEIENDIPVGAIQERYSNQSIIQVGEIESFSAYLDQIKIDEGKKFLANKVLFAEQITPLITKDMLEADARLKQHVKKLSQKIAGWNTVSL